MSDNPRIQRLREDLRTLQALRDESTIFEFVAADDDDPPDQYTLIFKGRGVRRDRNQEEGYADVDEHRCELRLGHSYPERPPEMRWVSQIYHPNITYSGFLQLKDLGLPWDKAISLDVVCERIWDTARMSYFDLKNASNYNAKHWIEEMGDALTFPLDPRPLRDGPSEHINAGSNVVRYKRKATEAGGERVLDLRDEVEPASQPDVFFIDEPDQPIRFASPVRRRGVESDDDILYID